MEVKYICKPLEDLQVHVMIYPTNRCDYKSKEIEDAPSLSVALDLIFRENIDDSYPFLTFVRKNDTIIQKWNFYPYEYENDFDVIRIIGRMRRI